MQRVWTVVLSVWAMLAIVAVLAWSHRPAPAALPQPAAQTLVVKTVHGKQQLVLVPGAAAGTTHATTATSGVVR
jgi:cyanate permease